jgi:hypothetical protein
MLIVALAAAVLVFPFMAASLFNAGAEAFFGAKEPMFETLGGLVIGAGIAIVLGAVVYRLARGRFTGLAWGIVIAMAAFDAAVVPFCRWLIRQAYASPTNVIEWW